MASLSSFPHPLSVSSSGDGSSERGANRTDVCKREEEEEGEGEEKDGEREVKVGEERGGEGDEGEGRGGESDEGNRETKEGLGGVVSEKGGSIETSEHIAAVEDGSGAALPRTTSDPVTSLTSPYIKLPTPDPPSGREVGGVSDDDKVGGAAGLWVAEHSTEEELTGQAAESSIATLGLTVTSSEARSSGDTSPEDSFRSALSTPVDTSLSLRQPTSDSQSPVPEADSHSPIPDPDNSVPQQTPPLSSQDTTTHSNPTSLSLLDPSTSQLQPSSSSSGQLNGGGTRQREDEAKWYITFEQFISCVQTEPDLCQFFAEQKHH